MAGMIIHYGIHLWNEIVGESLHAVSIKVAIAMSHPLFAPPVPQPKSQELTQQGGKSMAPPPFALQQDQGLAHAPAQFSQPTNPEWSEFASTFSSEFKQVLHVFDPEGGLEVGKGEASGAALTAEQAQVLFSAQQRDQLMDFMATNQIPERLFNGDDQGELNAAQRILISARILAVGTYAPGSFEQRVHAKFCGHWAQIVQNYAGVTRNSGGNSDSINGNFDIHGNVLMGAESEKPVGFEGKRVYMDDLPQYETDLIGPIYDSTAHGAEAERRKGIMEERAAQEAAGIEPKGKKPLTPFRETHLPFDQFGDIQPGDWLYIYNANGSGTHSVIFSHWASGEQSLIPAESVDMGYSDEIRYRAAVTFDQGTPAAGGVEHQLNLGSRFHSADDIKISPVTRIIKANPNQRPAQTVDELLPMAESKAEGKIEAKNETFLKSLDKKLGDGKGKEKLMELLRKENEEHIAYLGNRLTEGQRNLLQEANKADKIETLVRLTERLRQLHQNAEVLERNEKAIFEAKLNGEYDRLILEFETQEAAINAEKEPLLAEREPLAAELDAARAERDPLETYPEIQRARKQLRAVDKELKLLKKGTDEYTQKKAERKKIIADIEGMKAFRAENKDTLKELRSTINTKRRAIAKIDAKLAKLDKKLWDAYKILPWGRVAGGNNSDQDKSSRDEKRNGKLEDLISVEDAVKGIAAMEAAEA